MRQSEKFKCHWCDEVSTSVRYCHNCTFLSCPNCTREEQVTEWDCPSCETKIASEYCGTCGSKAESSQILIKHACSNCGHSKFSIPSELLKNVKSKYLAEISSVSTVLTRLQELYKTYDLFLMLVKQCRIGGVMAYPQVELQMKKCALALKSINDRGINQLMKVKSEGLFEVRSIQYFNGITIKDYRSAERIIGNVSKSISQVEAMINHWIDEVQIELDSLYKYAEPLRRHYELLMKVGRYLPEGVYNVGAILPPVPANIKIKRNSSKFTAYIIFTESDIIFLPEKQDELSESVRAVRVDYQDIKDIGENLSMIVGSQLILKISNGEVKINAPPSVNKGIKKYFDLLLSEDLFMVGSAKEILEIQENDIDKTEFKRAVGKFIDIFRERLFGTLPANRDRPKMSMNKLMQHVDQLKSQAFKFDMLAKDLKIDPETYQNYTSTIKKHLQRLEDNLNAMGGHFKHNYNLRKTLSENDDELAEKSRYPRAKEYSSDNDLDLSYDMNVRDKVGSLFGDDLSL